MYMESALYHLCFINFVDILGVSIQIILGDPKLGDGNAAKGNSAASKGFAWAFYQRRPSKFVVDF